MHMIVSDEKYRNLLVDDLDVCTLNYILIGILISGMGYLFVLDFLNIQVSKFWVINNNLLLGYCKPTNYFLLDFIFNFLLLPFVISDAVSNSAMNNVNRTKCSFPWPSFGFWSYSSCRKGKKFCTEDFTLISSGVPWGPLAKQIYLFSSKTVWCDAFFGRLEGDLTWYDWHILVASFVLIQVIWISRNWDL